MQRNFSKADLALQFRAVTVTDYSFQYRYVRGQHRSEAAPLLLTRAEAPDQRTTFYIETIDASDYEGGATVPDKMALWSTIMYDPLKVGACIYRYFD